jgi:trehalose 2-sulfotransferase
VTARPIRTGYAICTAPRSGSNWFAELLSSTGTLGRPLEFFNGEGRRLLTDASYPLEPVEQVQWVLSSGATANGVYGLKIFPQQLERVTRTLRWSEALPNLRFIAWRRRDILGQALSLFRARQTAQWRSGLQPRQHPVYDEAHISACLHFIVRQYARWDLFFARNAVEPLRLVFEDALQAPQETCSAVASELDLPERPIVDLTRISVTVQRDDLTLEWRARYLAACSGLDRIEDL